MKKNNTTEIIFIKPKLIKKPKQKKTEYIVKTYDGYSVYVY